MRSLYVRFVATVFAGALLFSLPAFAGAAQETKPGDRLTADQVKALAASTSAADHQTLSRHFAALAAEYTADAAEHEALAKAYKARPGASETKRPGAADTAAHCERLAEYARRLAAEARQMASAHEEMPAPGVTTTPSAAMPESRSGDLLTVADVTALVASAASPADHEKLARHFSALAARFDGDAATHDALAKALRAGPNPSETKRPGAPDTAAHCERLASLAKQAAGEARQLATTHEQMAVAAK
jgi:hypothetical protein